MSKANAAIRKYQTEARRDASLRGLGVLGDRERTVWDAVVKMIKAAAAADADASTSPALPLASAPMGSSPPTASPGAAVLPGGPKPHLTPLTPVKALRPSVRASVTAPSTPAASVPKIKDPPPCRRRHMSKGVCRVYGVAYLCILDMLFLLDHYCHYPLSALLGLSLSCELPCCHSGRVGSRCLEPDLRM